MKVFVRFQPSEKNDNFEGARLRKTIKGALEILNIPYTDVLMDDFDIAHLIYVEDDDFIQELKERKIPIVISALYCESDPSADYILYKNKDGERNYSIKPKALKFLECADLILVPNENAKQFLIDSGITNPIEICQPGVNFSRFDFSRDDEKELFYRYFNCKRDEKIVLTLGDFVGEVDGLGVVAKAANICKDTHFYYLAKGEKGNKMTRKTRKAFKGLPRNVTVSVIVPDDIYRSALLNADIFLYPGYKPPGLISIYEAMAAKCQLITRQHLLLENVAVDQDTAYVASYSETLAGIIKDYCEGKIQPTIKNAYKFVSKSNIKNFAKTINGYYIKLLNK